jgi:hypothetical protein
MTPRLLFPTILGDAWASLPAPIRAMHEGPGGEGQATIDRGRNPLARLAGWLVGFPPTAVQCPVSVHFDRRADGAEIWRRRFGDHLLTSTLSPATGRFAGLLTERFGPAAFDMALVPSGGRLELHIRRWHLVGIPLPLWLAPRSRAWEEDRGGQFAFHIELSHPLTGLIVSYSGTLERKD